MRFRLYKPLGIPALSPFAARVGSGLCLLALLLAACHDKLPLPEKQKTHLKQVMVLYIAAENTLSALSATDIAEIRHARQQIPEDCKVVIYLDNTVPDTKAQIISMDSATETTLTTYATDPNSCDSTVMRDALRHITQQFPADRYNLVLWSHGSGWLPARRRTFGVDNNRNTYSDTGSELEITALHWALQQTGVHWGWVLFDACFMQCAEVAYELRDVADWFIGSPAEIPGNGAPYDMLMPAFFAQEDAPRLILEGYYEAYGPDHGVVLSAVRSSAMEDLRNITRHCIDTLQAQPWDDIQQYCTDTKFTDYHDMNSAMHHWLSPADYTTWLAAFDRAVPHRRCARHWTANHHTNPVILDPDHFGGLSLYLPHPDRDDLNQAALRTDFWK